MKELLITVKRMSNTNSEATEGTVSAKSAKNVLKVLDEHDGNVLFSAHDLNVRKRTGRKDPLDGLEIPEEQKKAVRKGDLTIGMHRSSSGILVQLHEIVSDIA